MKATLVPDTDLDHNFAVSIVPLEIGRQPSYTRAIGPNRALVATLSEQARGGRSDAGTGLSGTQFAVDVGQVCVTLLVNLASDLH